MDPFYVFSTLLNDVFLIVLVVLSFIYVRESIGRQVVLNTHKLDQLSEFFGEEKTQISGRLAVLESTFIGDVSRWVRNEHGVFLSVSPAFVRMFLLPLNYNASDVLGKTLLDLTKFSPSLQSSLRLMDLEVVRRAAAARASVEISPGVRASIIKFAQSNPATAEVTFVAYAVPDEPSALSAEAVPTPRKE